MTHVVSSLMCLALLATAVYSQAPSTGGEAQVPSQPPSAGELLEKGRFQEAYTAATMELDKKPTDFQMLFIAGAAACELKNYDDGIEYLLEAIRAYPNGIRGEYREKLEACVVKKQQPAATAVAPKCDAQAPPLPFPAGGSFSWTHDDEGPECNIKVRVALSFYANGGVQYARSKICGSDANVTDAKVYTGRWTVTGNLVSMVFMINGVPATLTAEVVTKGNQKSLSTIGYKDLP